MLPDERMVGAASNAVLAKARERGWRGNDTESWILRADALAAVRAAFAALDRDALIEAGARAIADRENDDGSGPSPGQRGKAVVVLRAVGLIA